MTKLRNMLGIAFVAMSLLTGLAVSTAHACVLTDPASCEDPKEGP
jgi:hypothetical protein